MEKAKVYLISTGDRRAGVQRCLGHIGPLDYSGKRVFIKPNFNTADPAPGSTHHDTLDELLRHLRAANPAKLTLGERSGPADVAEVFEKKGIPAMCEQYGVELVNFERLSPSDWVTLDRPGLHWPGGLQTPRVVAEADAVVCTCCLKTHGFGGVYSNALKLAVGLVPKDFETLHGSPDMRKMIAEINLAYTPDFVLSDAVEVFTDGGPMEGVRKRAELMFIGSDRVALDAVGLAILKSLGSNRAIMDTPIFEQEQVARAVELGLGVSSSDAIEVVTDDGESERAAQKIREILQRER